MLGSTEPSFFCSPEESDIIDSKQSDELSSRSSWKVLLGGEIQGLSHSLPL